MTRDLFAINAQGLLNTRRKGFMPSGSVYVDLMASDLEGIAIRVSPEMPLARLDWRMLVDLEVQVWADVTVPITRIVAATVDIAEAFPRQLFVMFDHKGRAHTVDVGQGTHRGAMHGAPAEHGFLWLPIPTGGTRIARKVCQALQASRNGAKRLWN